MSPAGGSANENGAFSGAIGDRDQVRQGTVAFVSEAHVGVFNTSYRDAIRGRDLNGGSSGGYMFSQFHGCGQVASNAYPAAHRHREWR